VPGVSSGAGWRFLSGARLEPAALDCLRRLCFGKMPPIAHTGFLLDVEPARLAPPTLPSADSSPLRFALDSLALSPSCDRYDCRHSEQEWAGAGRCSTRNEGPATFAGRGRSFLLRCFRRTLFPAAEEEAEGAFDTVDMFLSAGGGRASGGDVGACRPR
jgi:hypothetical protein